MHQRREVPVRCRTYADAATVLRRACYRRVGDIWEHKTEPPVRVVDQRRQERNQEAAE